MIGLVRRTVMVMLVAAMYAGQAQAAGNGFPVPALDDSLSASKELRTVVLAGGCFWGMEEVFQHVRGVTGVVSGYAGGSARNAKYDLVSTGTTGHAESVKVTYDASAVTFGRLLQIYFSVAHDPTQRDGQGPDLGPQYRSSIFFSNERQQQIASAYIKQLGAAKVYRAPLTTEVVALEGFFPAEAYTRTRRIPERSLHHDGRQAEGRRAYALGGRLDRLAGPGRSIDRRTRLRRRSRALPIVFRIEVSQVSRRIRRVHLRCLPPPGSTVPNRTAARRRSSPAAPPRGSVRRR